MEIGARDDRDVVWMAIAWSLSRRSTCARRAVGCALIDTAGKLIGTGYNGAPKGMEHCTSNPCPGADLEHGEGLELCEAVHAEANALLQARDIDKIEIAYVTSSPCIHCVKLLLNSSCKRIVYATEYAAHFEYAKLLWENQGREWVSNQND